MRLACCLLSAAMATAVENESSKLAVASACPLDPGGVEAALQFDAQRATRFLDGTGDVADRGGATGSWSASASLLVGITDGIDLGASLCWLRLYDAAADPDAKQGLGDVHIASTIRLAEAPTWALAIIPHLDLPTRSDVHADTLATCSPDLSWGAELAATWERGRFTTNLAGGLTRFTGPSAKASEGLISAGLAGGYTLLAWLQPELDLAWRRDLADGEAVWSLTGFAGVQIPHGSWRGAAGIGRTLAGRQTDVVTALTASLTWIW